MKLFDFGKRRAEKLHREAQQLDDAGETEAAIATYREAIALDPDKAESHYNLGLIYKYRGDWHASFEFNRQANRLDPQDEAARWNLAIAATALRNWATARAKWAEHGIAMEGDAGPIEMDFGVTPVRLNPQGDAEVVWATRIDPARARIDNIPFLESGFHYGDVVLNDGAPVGYREWDGREYPVFNVLERFEPSAYSTCVANVVAASQADLDALDGLFAATRSHCEDWTRTTRMLCKACSEGRPHDHHDPVQEDAWSPQRRLGVALHPDDDVRQILERWQQTSGAQVLSLEGAPPVGENEALAT